MKKIFIVFLINISLTVFSQEREATIIFNDSTSVKGFGEIKKEKIHFRLSLGTEKSVWSYDMAYGLIFSGYGFSEKYVYVKPDEYSKPKLMEVIEEGKVNLYKKSSYKTSMGIGFMGGSGIGVGPSVSHYYATEYFVKRKNEEHATDLSLRFKSTSSRYFSDCQKLVEKISNKKFREDDIIEIVYYYNDYCGDEEEK